MRRGTGVAAAGVAVALVCAGAGAATSAPRTSGAHRAHASTPKLTITMGKGKFKVSGPTTFAAGRVALKLTATNAERVVTVAQLHKGYTFKHLRADIAAFGKQAGSGKNGSTPKPALKHLNNAINHINLYGGLDSTPGQTEQETVVLPKAGTYIMYDDSGNLPKSPKTLHVTGPAANRATPKTSATVKALTKRRWGGSKVLPANGTITVANHSTESPHFLILQHVKKGTTRKDVLNYFQSGAQGPPSFGLQGQAATSIIGKGNQITFSYKVPKGEYVELCFFPDPKTGMPHAFMGMIGIVNLK